MGTRITKIETAEKRIAACLFQMNASEICFIENALEAGDILNAQKALLDHGDWSDWLEEHWSKSGRSARDYMRYAADIPRVKALECTSWSEVKRLGKLASDANLNQESSGKQPKIEKSTQVEPDSTEVEIEGDIPADAGPVDIQITHRDEPPIEVYEDVEDEPEPPKGPDWKKLKAKAIATGEAMQRAIDDLHAAKPASSALKKSHACLWESMETIRKGWS